MYSENSGFAGRQLSNCGIRSPEEALKSVANPYAGVSSDVNMSTGHGIMCVNVVGLSVLTELNSMNVSHVLTGYNIYPHH